MLKRVITKVKGVQNTYLKYRKTDIDPNGFLLEAGQGKNINGNMFAIARELCTNPAWKKFKVYWVVTEDTLQSAKDRFSFYSYNVEFVVRLSDEYAKLLATCKYLLTDNSFPPFFIKRNNQIYLNTWHGTPLKTLGKSDIKNAKSLANIQKNYLMADYALFPNLLTRNVFMKDYMLESLYRGNILMCDYPRNSVFLDLDFQEELRQKLGLMDKQLIAYMPTWRGSDRTADAIVQKKILEKYFEEIDKKLEDDQIFYVNLHFLVGNTMDYSKYKHIKPFPKEYETYDFLSICDILVTDYSSVFFDFAITKKKIILFTYDLNEYMEERGTYFSIEELPFPIVETVVKLINEINYPRDILMEQFLNEFCRYRDLFIPEKIVDLLVHGEKKNLILEKNEKQDLVLVYVGALKGDVLNQYLLNEIDKVVDQYPDKKVIVCFRGAVNDKRIEFLSQLNEKADYLALVKKYNFSLYQVVKARLSLSFTFFDKLFNRGLRKIINQERNRFFYSIKPGLVINMSGKAQYINLMLETFKCPKAAYILPKPFAGTMISTKIYKKMCADASKKYDQVIDLYDKDVKAYWNDKKETYYNASFQLANIIHRFHNTSNSMNVWAVAVMRNAYEFDLGKIHCQINEKNYPCHINKLFSLNQYVSIVTYKVEIPTSDIMEFEIQNKLKFVYQDENGYGFEKGCLYSALARRKGKNKQGPIKIFEKNNTSAYFRQSKNNVLYLTVRKKNLTDKTIEQIKLDFAYYLSKIMPKKKIVLLYEKESSRYEESASVLYEKLIDDGYKDAYFILDKNYSHFHEIANKYRTNILYKGSFKHYLYFFMSKTFLGSEALVHAIDLRISNKHALNKINDKSLNYVFLQHGVMYMVSLDSESRSFFKPMKTEGKYRVVTSSVEEARHFIELGGYDPETIYVCGLPKFDRNTLNEDADKIVVMPTWRPWEYNEARYDFTQTKYYQMLVRIVDAIPEKFKDKLIVLPHPLFFDAIKDTEFELKQYLNVTDKYDDILKDTRILITDYSSIAYDAFYRGCNVIFYWEEKDECMANYGPTTKLMLNEENVYGDICMNPYQLSKAIDINYFHGQDEVYQKRYSKLVDFHDGKNTERLITLLRKDEII